MLTLSTTALQIVETSSDDLVLGLGYKINNFRIGGSRRNVKNSKSLVTNDLTLRADVSLPTKVFMRKAIPSCSISRTRRSMMFFPSLKFGMP